MDDGFVRLGEESGEEAKKKSRSGVQGEGGACGGAGRQDQLLERAGEVFGGPRGKDEPQVDVKAMQAKIGQLALENDFLEGALIKAGMLSAKR